MVVYKTPDFDFLQDFMVRYSDQTEFLQAVHEIATSLTPLFDCKAKGEFYQRAFLTLVEPERTIKFRVTWMDDHGKMQINRGWRVEFCSALGPYKGGLRFHPTVNESVLKFLGFEQIFKNALTGLPMGGGKGGSDFDPKGKSDAEVTRFCQSFMTELYRYIGPSTDVPAGDIGVGGREIGALYGQYKRITNTHGDAVLTGKSALFGGSPLRPEATGYGLVYIAEVAIKKQMKTNFHGKRCAISGSGNVAQYTAEKLLELAAKVITMSDSNGMLVFDEGMTKDDLKVIFKAKQEDRARLWSIESKVSGRYIPNVSPWSFPKVQFDFAFPCATQNEIHADAAKLLIKQGILGVFEGANMPTALEAQALLRNEPSIIYLPGKAANAGGVVVSGFEMSQNAEHLTWDQKSIDIKLKKVMTNIYEQMCEHKGDKGTLEEGANRAAFVKVATAMLELGWVY
mmetsp:Transcript_17941/g.27910  ORF Transcript_17941/g.27910 Transcript_17941/m.27910 type:complete len:455 (+) Transcript_17941:273-1637(+)